MAVRHADVDPQHLAEQLRRILRAMIGIVAGAAVAEADVEEAVGTEREVAAVVIRERLRDERLARRAAPAQIEARRRHRPITPLSGRRNRATTVSPERLVKLTKKRPLVACPAETRGRAAPARRPRRSPPTDRESPRRATLPLRTTRMRPSCCTTNCTARSAGSCTNAIGSVKPDACVRNLSCAPSSAMRHGTMKHDDRDRARADAYGYPNPVCRGSGSSSAAASR